MTTTIGIHIHIVTGIVRTIIHIIMDIHTIIRIIIHIIIITITDLRIIITNITTHTTDHRRTDMLRIVAMDLVRQWQHVMVVRIRLLRQLLMVQNRKAVR